MVPSRLEIMRRCKVFVCVGFGEVFVFFFMAKLDGKTIFSVRVDALCSSGIATGCPLVRKPMRG